MAHAIFVDQAFEASELHKCLKTFNRKGYACAHLRLQQKN